MIKMLKRLERLKNRERTEAYYRQMQRILFPASCEFIPAAFGKDCNEIQAKEVLADFFAVLCEAAPEKELEIPSGATYYSFLVNMIPIRNALKQRKYALACHELASLFYHDGVLQERIYYNLIDLYQKYVEEK